MKPSTEAVKEIVFGLGLMGLMAALILQETGNPLSDLALLKRGQSAPGLIVEAGEEVELDDHGRNLWTHWAVYSFRLPDGGEVSNSFRRSGRLAEKFRNLEQSYPIEVEYLPENPAVSRIKGSGSKNTFEWIWRKGLIPALGLVVLLAPGGLLVIKGIRRWRGLPIPRDIDY